MAGQKRLRVVAVTVALAAFTDDGEQLTPLTVEPVQIAYSEWEQFARDGFPAAVEALAQQVAGNPIE